MGRGDDGSGKSAASDRRYRLPRSSVDLCRTAFRLHAKDAEEKKKKVKKKEKKKNQKSIYASYYCFHAYYSAVVLVQVIINYIVVAQFRPPSTFVVRIRIHLVVRNRQHTILRSLQVGTMYNNIKSDEYGRRRTAYYTC